jgi:hypothetical protein
MSFHHSPKIATDGLVFCLDAANRKSYPRSGSLFRNLSGGTNNASLINSPVFDGENSGSIKLNGTNQYISSNYSFTNRPFSINAWFYFNTLASWSTILGQDTSITSNLGAFYFQKVDSGGGGGGRVGNTFGIAMTTNLNGEVYCYDPVPVSALVWYNYCISVSSNNLILYKNGKEVKRVNDSSTLAPPIGPISIGAGYYLDTIGDFCNIKLSQLSIYNRAITSKEAIENYNALKGRFNL